jgi:hypothetical protein
MSSPIYFTPDDFARHFAPLVGRQLSILRRGGDMLILHFGSIRRVERGTVGDYALHIQCPWRLEGRQGIITGRADLWEPVDTAGGFDPDQWNYDTDGNLQDARLGELFARDPLTRSLVNTGDQFVVEADRFGGVALELSGGYRLALFPAGTRGECWRLFRPDNEAPHIVFESGQIFQD